jgi:hypothetical protein
VGTDRGPVTVDSVDGKSVVFRVSPWARAEGERHFWLNFEGYKLDELVEGGFINAQLLDSEENVVAATALNLGYNWDDHNGKWMDLEFESVDHGGMTTGLYKFNVISDNWDEDVSLRIDEIHVLSEPFVDDYINPWILGVNQSGYTISVSARNLNRLDNERTLAFELRYTETNELIEQVDNVNIEKDYWGNGYLSATFATTLPSEPTTVKLVVGYLDNGIVDPLPGGERYLDVTDGPVVYHFYSDSNEPAQVYNLTFDGWNLPGQFTVRISRDGNEIWSQAVSSSSNGATVQVDFGYELAEGHYDVEVYDEHFYAGFGWGISVPEPWADFAEGDYDFTEQSVDGADFTLVLNTEHMTETGQINASVWLEGRDGTHRNYQADLSFEVDKIIADFTGVQPGTYEARASIKYQGHEWGTDRGPVTVDSVDGKSVVFRVSPWARAEGERHFWLNFEGYKLDELVEGGFINAQLLDSEENVVAATALNLGYNWDDHNGKWMDLEFESVDHGGMTTGLYKFNVISDNWDEDVSLRIDEIHVLSEPFVDDYINPWILGVNQSGYTISVSARNLNRLDNERTLAFKLRYTETNELIEQVDNVNIEKDYWGNGYLSATFATTLPSEPTTVKLVVGYLDNGIVDPLPGGERYLDVTDGPVVYHFYSDSNEPAQVYNLTFDGWNLPGQFTVRISRDGNEIWSQAVSSSSNGATVQVDFGYELAEGHYDVEVYDEHFYAGFGWGVYAPEPPGDLHVHHGHMHTRENGTVKRDFGLSLGSGIFADDFSTEHIELGGIFADLSVTQTQKTPWGSEVTIRLEGNLILPGGQPPATGNITVVPEGLKGGTEPLMKEVLVFGPVEPLRILRDWNDVQYLIADENFQEQFSLSLAYDNFDFNITTDHIVLGGALEDLTVSNLEWYWQEINIVLSGNLSLDLGVDNAEGTITVLVDGVDYGPSVMARVTVLSDGYLATVSGTVIDSESGNGLEGINVWFWNYDTWSPEAVTDSNGNYQASVFPGNYNVHFYDESENYLDGRSNEHEFESGQSYTINVSLIPAALAGTLTGRFVDDNDNPVEGVMVFAQSAGYDGDYCTDADGEFSIPLAAGTYNVLFVKGAAPPDFAMRLKEIVITQSTVTSLGDVKLPGIINSDTPTYPGRDVIIRLTNNSGLTVTIGSARIAIEGYGLEDVDPGWFINGTVGDKETKDVFYIPPGPPGGSRTFYFEKTFSINVVLLDDAGDMWMVYKIWHEIVDPVDADNSSAVFKDDNGNGTATITVTVKDDENNAITGLTEDDFSIMDPNDEFAPLMGTVVSITEVGDGVYEIVWQYDSGTHNVNIRVLSTIVEDGLEVTITNP